MFLRFTFHITLILYLLDKLPVLNGKILIRLCISDRTITTAHFISAKSSDLITCGSILKLYNVDYKIRLHSHDVKYGSGSGQQSVTGIGISEDLNSHWAVKGATGQHCSRG